MTSNSRVPEMHSLLSRANAVSSFGSTVFMVVLAAVALTSLLIPTHLAKPSLNVSTLQVMVGRSPHDWERREREYAFAKFDISADLTPLFNWNTKQLFVYFVAEYDTPKFPTNQVVVWDRIVRRKGDARINLSGAKNKYAFKEISESFSNVTAQFSLQYNLMPWVGFQRYGEAGRTESIAFPPPKRTLNR